MKHTTSDPPISHTINDSGVMPIVGNNYYLYCQVSGIEVNTYEWRKDNNQLNETGAVLTFSPLNLVDAGQYRCIIESSGAQLLQNMEVTIDSKLILMKNCSFH